MNNLWFSLALLAGTMLTNTTTAQEAEGTEWIVSTSPGLDALLLIGMAAGNELQEERYADEISWLMEQIDGSGKEALKQLDKHIRQDSGALTGPALCLFFSGYPTASIDDLLTSARQMEARIMSPLKESPFWGGEDSRELIERTVPPVKVILEQLQQAGYAEWYQDQFGDQLQQAVEKFDDALSGYDIIPIQQHLLGQPLDPHLRVDILKFSWPHGIRVLGQRFISHPEYDIEITLHVARHELFHPPFDFEDQHYWQALAELEKSELIQSILEHSNPAYGYNSFEALVNEGSAQALDHLVAEKMDMAHDPGERWRESDGGMHLLAAALYHAMKEDEYHLRGGDYGKWLLSAVERGLINGDAVRERAIEVVGREAVESWISRKAESD
ncbi:hypothetical protein IC757_03670 [Wenzhouxiangella sp. AB-CW3]|uniref:hypothetical protein n=1 Tax=Wenzhouxiangella sp. AB-CW3 TaxID=2771012 RepID=UPI00168AEAA0|nr:hypothetical protein [Wenzhouxiangella sp. AB-CW3]QOC23261.1 hypothetical protein IC757_03670 [Wenzhouxiangella sp. AB-CW3]